VDLIGRHVNLKKSGRNFVGLCPFHSEKTPSFNVNVERQIFHCFGCGEGGNAITFLMKHENLTFPESARALARELGIEVPERETSGEAGLGEKLRAANQVAQALYAEALTRPQAEAARDYLARRGLGSEEIERFGIGFAPGSGRALLGRLEREKIPASLGTRAGLLGKSEHGDRHYDMLRGRITFPIQDARGQVLGFGGRALSDEVKPKYLNTPESPVYKKREVFYGLHFGLAAMRRAGRAVVVEGYFDCIAMHRAGVEEAVATCGTALTVEHARALRRRTSRVVLVFDGDDAGRHAVEASLRVLLPEGLRVEAVLLPSGQDPDDLLVAEGPEGLRARVDAAEPALELVIRQVVERGCSTPWEKSDAVAAVAPLLALVPDGVERSEFARRLALAVDVEASFVEQALRQARRGGEPEAREAVPEPPRRADRRVRWAQDLVAAVVAEPALAGAEPHETLCALVPESPAREALALALAEAARAGLVDVAAIEAECAATGAADGAALSVLRAVALEGRFAEAPDRARRAFHDVVSRLHDAAEREAFRERRRERQGREAPTLSAAELLAEAQLRVEQKRRRSQHPQRPHGGVAN